MAIGTSGPSDERAMEEWRQLHAVITRAEHQEFQIRSWLLLILSALVIAMYSEKTKLSGAAFGSVSALLSVIFAFAELVTRVTKRKALWRVDEVEEALRGEKPYDGPKITLSLATFWDQKALTELMRNEARVITVWSFYLPIWLAVLLLAFWKA